MAGERQFARSRRITQLVEKFRNKRYRDSYVSATNRRFLAQQIRALRGDMSQEDFGKLIGKPQSVVSRLEDPNYGKLTQQTIHEVAAALNRAVITRIVDFPTFLRFTEDMSEQALCPTGYDEQAMDRFALGLPVQTVSATSDRIGSRISADAGDQVLIRATSSASAEVAHG
jgi:hypothetical protein